MRTLSILTAAAGILLAISGPSLSASRTQAHRSADAYSAYARDNADSAFWTAPYAYAPYGASRDATYGFERRNPADTFGAERNVPQRGPVGTIRNDW